MQPNRRDVLKQLGWVTAAGTGLAVTESASASSEDVAAKAAATSIGVLVDTTKCIGCRLCEYACKVSNGMPAGDLKSYEDPSVFRVQRRPSPHSLTVINAHKNPADESKPVYSKLNCMHCNHCACGSACIVGALKKQPNGAVTYDAWKCIGCRYCMVACPFQLPTYDYDNAFTPQIFKCQMCFERKNAAGQQVAGTRDGGTPACVDVCPREAMTFGKRTDLIAVAHERIAKSPDKYVNHVYGEHEAGGTAWMYLASVPFEKIGFFKHDSTSPAVLTEAIQHGVFSPKFGVPPLLLYGTLGALMLATRPKKKVAAAGAGVTTDAPATAEAMPQPAAAAEGATLARESSAVAVLEAPVAVAEPPSNGDGATLPPHPAKSHAHDHNGHHDHDEEPQPVARKLLTPGVYILLGLMAVGIFFTLKRFIFGLASTTNLDQQYPWGLWIGIDVATGVALAAGGFTSAFLAHVIHREKYHAIIRPALLTATLGYTFVVLGLQADLGRYYNVWHPMLPSMWQGNSVLFEVGICVMCYLNVLYLEFAPIVCERFMHYDLRFPRITRLATWMYPKIDRIMFLLIIAGCCLSCLHQSSLGNLMVIAPSKLHPLWWSPAQAGIFLASAIMVGFPMIVWESLFAGWSLKLKPEMSVLTPLARFVPFTLGGYLLFKLADMWARGSHVYLGDGSAQSMCWMLEVGLGVVLPLALLLVPRVRRSPLALFGTMTLVIGGVLFNRVNVFIIGYRPPFAEKTYVPSFGEFAVTIGLIAALMFVYRVCVTYLPIIAQPKGTGRPKARNAA